MPSIINNVNILNTIYLLPSKINHLRIVGKSYSIKKNKRHRIIFSKVLTKEYIISDLRPHAILGVLSDIFFISLSSSSRLIHNHAVSQWGLPVDFLLIWDWRNSDIKAGSPVLYIYKLAFHWETRKASALIAHALSEKLPLQQDNLKAKHLREREGER